MVKKKSTWSDLPHIVLYSAITAIVLYAGWAISIAYQNDTFGTQQIVAPNPSEPVIACTMDAKVCPDGSSVGRKGPSCQFEACPVR